MKFTDATTEEINAAMEKSWDAFLTYRKLPLQRRLEFMYAIANELDNIATPLVEIASQETNLPKDRLESERKRTVFQLKSYADACKRGDWLDARIDTAIPDKTPPKPDIRKMMVPLGPVVVFGASNFPFAYSTAGGDTACAFAAGCPVIVKAHPAHAETSEMVANAIFAAAKKTHMPDGIFAHIHGEGFETGKALVLHPRAKAAQPDSYDALHSIAYVSFQELATRIAHRNTGKVSGDPNCERLLSRIAQDENLHMLFYRNLLNAAFELDPDQAMRAVTNVVRQFQMPGSGLQDFGRKSVLIAKAGIYDLRIHHDEVVMPILRQTRALERTDLGAEGEIARAELVEFLDGLDCAATRFCEKREALLAKQAARRR